MAYSPDGKVFVTGSGSVFFDRGAVKFFNAETHEPTGLILSHKNEIKTLAFSPDGQTLLAGYCDQTAQWWDVNTGQVFRSELSHGGIVDSVAFHPKGQLVATGSSDGIVRLWNNASGRSVGPPQHLERGVKSVAFAPDGKTIVAGSCGDLESQLGGEFVRWNVPIPVQGNSERITLWAQVITGMELSGNGAIHLLDHDVWHERRRQLEELGGPPN